GGLLAAPIARPFVMLAPGERIELWTDFVSPQPSEGVWLESHAFDIGGSTMGGGMGMMGGGMGMMGGGTSGGPSLANGAAFRICRFIVKGKGTRLPLPRY